MEIELENNNSYKCFVCDKTFQGEELLKTHSIEHTVDSEYKIVSSDSSALFDHHDVVFTEYCHNEKNFVGHAENSVKLDVDVSAYNEGKYVCAVCTKQFKRKDHLNKHSVLHTGIKPFVCMICCKRFSRKDRLKEHCAVIHLLNGWTCYFCGQIFPQSCILRKHELIHRGIKPFCCDLCSKQFSRKNDLMRHCMSHTGEKPHLCKICNKRFSQKRLLNRHSLLHLKSM